MGAQLSTVAAATTTVPIDAYIAELGDLAYASDIGKSRFLKSVKAVHRDGMVVVKVFIKPTSVQIDIDGVRMQVQTLCERLRENLGPLNKFPNVIGYSRIVETERAGYLVRQFIKYNLYDRMSTRPFLDTTEKKWIAYQILRALQTCHANNICHGDIKSENVLVGSYKWVYLTDFAPFKPVHLPETDSAQFLYYFDTSQRRACYVAPERFSTDIEKLTPAHDIYSAGCVIGELFLEGQPLLTLADLFKYKRGEYMPSLDGVDAEVKELIYSMISVDPANRFSAEEYLLKYKTKVFPSNFDKIWDLLEPFSGTKSSPHNSDAMIQHLWDNIETEYFSKALECPPRDCTMLPTQLFPVVITLPHSNWKPEKRQKCPQNQPLDQSGASILLSFVCSALTSTSTLSARLKAAQLILVLSEFVTDDMKLDICLPYLVQLLKDNFDEIRTASLALLTHLLSLVERYSRLNLNVYSAYLFPRLQQAINQNNSTTLKTALAACLSKLTEYAVQCEGWSSIAALVGSSIHLLLTDSDNTVRRAVLENADELCAVLRKQGTNEIVLSHVITYLNDKNLLVSKDFFMFITRVSPLLGPVDLEQYILPLMMQTIFDDREELVAVVLKSLTAVVSLGLLKMRLLLGTIVPACAKFLIHPNVYIRTQTLLLISTTASQLSDAEVFGLLRPILSPTFLNNEVYDFKEYSALISALKPPINAKVYSLALKWASEAKNTMFWAQDTQQTSLSTEDRQYLEKLYEVGFKDSDLWQLYVFRSYLWNLSVMHKYHEPKRELHGVEKIRDVKYINLNTNTNEENVETVQNAVKIEPMPLEDASPRKIVQLGTKLVGTSLKPMSETKPIKLPDMKPTVLVACLKAHRGAIQVLSVHSNQRLFITAADDGIVKLWDTTLLLKGSSRPMATYSINEPITAGSFMLDSSVIVIGTVSGKIKFLNCVFKGVDGNFVFDSLVLVSEFDLGNSHAIAFHAVPSNSSDELINALYILVAESKIVYFHLKSQKIAYEFEVPAEYGPLTSWLWDNDDLWVLVGTMHGMLNLFDTRFRLRLQSWGIGDLTPIADIKPHPVKHKWVCIAGGFEKPMITVWDLQRLEVREVLVPASTDFELPSLAPIMETQQLLERRFAAWDITASLSNQYHVINAISTLPISHSHASGSCHLLSGGSDRTLRCWNTVSPHESFIISGHPLLKNKKVYYTGKVGASMRGTYEQQSLVKTKQKLVEEDGRSHNGSISHVAYLQTGPQLRDMAISVDEVGVIRVFS